MDPLPHVSDAMPCILQESLDLTVGVVGGNHLDAAATYGNMGSVLYAQGLFDQALAHYGTAQKIMIRALGADHLDVATTFTNMSLVYAAQRKHDLAKEFADKAHKIKTAAERAVLVQVNEMLNCVNEEWFDESRDTGADALAAGAARNGGGGAGAEKDDANDAGNVDLAKTYNNMGAMLQQDGKHEQALEYYNQGLAIKIKAAGYWHLDVAKTFNNIGEVHRLQGDVAKALECYRKALDITTKVADHGHLDVAAAYSNMAAAHFSQVQVPPVARTRCCFAARI